jgi:hypothetical protein
LYYLCAVALGIIVFYLDIDITENVGKKYNWIGRGLNTPPYLANYLY